jgi:hypothetical protein
MAALVALIQASWLDRIETAATRAALAEARARANDRLIEAQAAEVELLREIRAVQDAEPMEPGPIATTPLVASPVAQGRAQFANNPELNRGSCQRCAGSEGGGR